MTSDPSAVEEAAVMAERQEEWWAEPATCPTCDGEGIWRDNIARNRDGVWEYDEHECDTCDGYGAVPA